ncbi:MAG: hypothetical protein UY07_C0004G0018 [Parcubacteria group bacterium GW2011_GWA1_47_8]|nr:MAG: hypothetical protein UY07_C0004G0018 [Parcubacteria group bacterium GW2011_GWA1_47_8]
MYPFVNYKGTLFSPVSPPLGFATTTPYPPIPYIIPDKREYAGIISSSTKDYNLYTNKRYGFELNYPKEFTVGENILGSPVDGKEESGQFWISSPTREAHNDGTISIQILHSKEYSVRGNEKIVTKKQTLVAGQHSYLYSINEYYPGSSNYNFILYIVPIPTYPGKYLGVTLHNDPTNFSAIDKIIQSIVWLQ